MLSPRQHLARRLHQLLDAVLLLFVFWLSHTLRAQVSNWNPTLIQIPEFREFFWILAFVVPFTPIVLCLNGYYEHPMRRTVRQSLSQFVRALLWVGLMVGASVIFLKWTVHSRSVILIFIPIAGAALLAKDAALKAWMLKRLRSGKMRIRVVLAGPDEDLDAVWTRLPEFERLQMEVVARVDLSKEPVKRLSGLFREKNIERVIFAAEHLHFYLVETAVRACETEGVEAWLSTEFLNTERAKPTFDLLGDQPMLVFRNTPANVTAMLAKEIFDRTLAAILLLISAPFLVVAWIGIKLSSPGPAIFCQERGGRYGKPFKMYKFRTMNLDADSPAVRQQLLASNEQDGPAFKMKRDPRVFRFGAFLRKTSIDELPQLLNILKGEMSLVGPRPLPVYEVEKIEKSAQRRRLSVKPGLTCLWQISGRSGITDFDQWVELDLEYIDNWSFWLDLKILCRTAPVVLSGGGAR
ncbi:MAG: exopolysaccharide biosynthesis polyprenyl glycosylphosphotransferase [Verrucomicrobiales bacterium]|jgi:exopolysaccharide biosynthesis polyprenyl glycosylphosphotransferase